MPSIVRTLLPFSTCLLVFGADLASQSRSPREHLLFRAIRDEDHGLLRSLLRGKVPLEIRRSDGTTPLLYAATLGIAQAVRILLDHGADPKATNRAGATALHYGAFDPEIVKPLLRRGADPKAHTKRGNTPLHIAAAHPRGTPAVELLLAAGADVNALGRSDEGMKISVLMFAAATGNLETIRLLLESQTGFSSFPGWRVNRVSSPLPGFKAQMSAFEFFVQLKRM